MKRKIGAIVLLALMIVFVVLPMAAMADPPEHTAWFKCYGNTVWQAMNCITWAILHGIDDIDLIPF